jgi:hypothetical protein
MKLLKSHELNGTCPGGWFLGNYTLGLERTVIRVNGRPYLGRWILYVGNRTLRLHRFYRGDDDRAPHDHPWPFWTFPLCSGYDEIVARGNVLVHERVKGWRWNFRPSSYRHIVIDPPEPFYTIVVTGCKDRGWGFWPGSETFVPWREWTKKAADFARTVRP